MRPSQTFPVPTWVRAAVCLALVAALVLLALTVYTGRPVAWNVTAALTIMWLATTSFVFRRE